MYLYGHLTPGSAESSRGTLGQEAPAIGEIVDGTQQLRADVASNVITFLQTRYFVQDPTNTGFAGALGYLAVTPESLNQAGIQLEGLPTAGQQIAELPASSIAVVDVNDTMAVLAAQPPAQYHVALVPSRDAAKTLAQPGTNWAVLQPRMGGGGAMTTTAPSTAGGGGLTTATLVGAAIGAGIGALVAGPVGAIVGGLAVGVIVNRSQA